MELLDVYDIQGKSLNKKVVRNEGKLEDNEYLKVIGVFIKCGIRYLIQKRSKEKGGEYAITTGAVTSGNTPQEQAIIECKEELGLTVKKENLKFLGISHIGHLIFNLYLYEDDNVDLENMKFTLQQSEVESIKWISKNEIEDLILKNDFNESSSINYLKFIKDYE